MTAALEPTVSPTRRQQQDDMNHFSRLASDHGNTKSNPNVAMTERTGLEDWQAAGMSEGWRPYLTKDNYGRDISEPDWSNPTRSRYERPLDTIRSFESATYGRDPSTGSATPSEYDGGAQSRQSFSRPSNPQRGQSSASAYTTDANGDGGPRTPHRGSLPYAMPTSASWDARSPATLSAFSGAGSPITPGSATNNRIANNGVNVRGQQLSYGMPPTPPQDVNRKPPVKDEKKKKGFRLSFGKNKD
ncbi:hypothetical protein PYCC9005_002918 [Savitreella phatthalungensis]